MTAARRFAAAMLAAALFLPAARAGEGDAAPAKKAEPAKAEPAKNEPGKVGEKKSPAAAAKQEEAKKPAPSAKAAVAQRKTPRTKVEALASLDSIVINVDFDGIPLRDAVEHIAAVTGVNLILGPALINEGDLDVRKVTLRLKKVSVKQVLEFIVDGQGLGLGFRSGVLLVTTRKEARGAPVLKLYPAADFTMVIRDFPGPDLMLRPAGAEFEEPERTETKHPFSDLEEIVSLIKDNTGTGTWEDEDISASTLRDWIVVKQYPEVHQEIARLLALLRSAR